MILLCSGCAGNRTAQRLAAAEQGRAVAGVVLPAQPGECQRDIPHAAAVLGDNPVIVLARERGQLDLANDVRARCAGFYAQIKSGLEGN